MASLIFDVEDPIPQQLDLIKEAEGFGNRKATFTFLVKYYFLTKKRNLEESISSFQNALSHVDHKNIQSLEEQLKDV